MERLQNIVVINTRPEGRSDSLNQLLKAEGALVLGCPALCFEDTDFGVDALKREYDSKAVLAFTSVTGVKAFQKLWSKCNHEVLAPKGIWAVGPATAKALREIGFFVNLVAPESTGASLAEAAIDALGSNAPHDVMLMRGIPADDALPTRLREAGFEVRDIALYRSLPCPSLHQDLEALALQLEELHAENPVWVFSSPEGAHQIAQYWKALSSNIGAARKAREAWTVVAIGATTEQALREMGLTKIVKAKTSTPEALREAVVECVSLSVSRAR